jgi:hypothetical protein
MAHRPPKQIDVVVRRKLMVAPKEVNCLEVEFVMERDLKVSAAMIAQSVRRRYRIA